MDVVARAIIVFFVLLIATRAVGRRELNSLEPFDIILLVVIGDLVQQGVTQSDYSMTGAVAVVSTLALLTVATSYLSFRFPKLRPVLEGEPLVLLEDGKAIERNLRRERITLDELRAAAREEQVASLEDVHLAVLETTGRISFLTRSG
ncbi:MAG TPA: YetF domain-containing protein [Solirubrobacteraceae bacterium]|nr:YetF domain-containing protein [Solirubrobacteraceae bacterium]